MLRGYLVTESGEQGPRRVPVGSRIVVGRAADCGFLIDDPAASRWHVEITRERDTFHWRDLGSTNGTSLNGAQQLGGELASGDKLQIGETVIAFDIEEVPAEEVAEDETTTFKETIMDWPADVSHLGAQAKQGDLLRAVYAIANEIASNYEPCSLVDRVLEVTVNAIDAQRGAVLFAGRPTSGLMPCPKCRKFHVIQDGKTYHLDEEQIHISKTVAAHVLSGGESVLFQSSTGGDLASDSVISLNLRSIICVPLRGKYGILGLLYIDTDRPERQYTHDDMLLATAVGNSAGLALENATMHVQLLEKQRMEQEIEHAWQIQESFLLTQWPQEDPRFRVFGETKPAKTVGGDFYDFVRPSPDLVGILIGDVSGKGVPAALAMAQLLTVFRVRARETASPVEVLRSLNDELYARSQRGMFCTVAYLLADVRSGEIRCANAGHYPALCATQSGPRLFGSASGPPIGVIDQPVWAEETAVVGRGDVVLLFTDGIIEARVARTQYDMRTPPAEFGLDRLCRLVNGLRGKAPKELVDAVNREVAAFCAPSLPHDDRTMVALGLAG